MLSTHKPPASSSPHKLTRTNFRRLQRELEVHQARLKELSEQGVVRAKDKNMRKMVHTVSSLVFLLLLCVILWGNYVMLAPHLSAVSTAGLAALVLDGWRELVRCRVERFQAALRGALAARGAWALIAALACGCASVLASAPSLSWPALCLTLLSLLCLCASRVDARALTAGLLTLFVVCALALPLLLAAKRCVHEVNVVATLLLGVVESEAALHARLGELLHSRALVSLHARLAELLPAGSVPDPRSLDSPAFSSEARARLRQLADVAGANAQAFSLNALTVASDLSNVLWACTTFATTLLYLLSEESPWPFFNALSPLAPDDNIRLYNDVKTSTMRILLCSLAVFCNHAVLTGATLWLNDAPIIALPSFLCGLFAVMPLLGTYVVVLPAAALLWAQDAVLSAVALGVAECALVLFIDARITALIPGNPHFVALSLVAGLYSFGPLGVLYGPLLVGLAGSLVRIYMRYLKKPLNSDLYSPQPPSLVKNLFSANMQQTPTL